MSVRHWDAPPYARFIEAGGVVDISVGEGAEDTLGCHAEVLSHALGRVDARLLSDLEPIEIEEEVFHGTYFDCGFQLLVHDGVIGLKDGGTLERPFLRDLETYESGSWSIPDLWMPGGFAYAFCQPPYPLQMRPKEIQKTYAEVIGSVAPRGKTRILNWHNEALLTCAPRLEIGTYWWGVFAFTTFVPATSRVFGLVAATSS